MFTLQIHPRVKKQAKRLHPQDQKRLIKVLSRLAGNPFSPSLDTKKLTDTKASYRLRVSNFRILYSLDTKKRVVYVWEVGYRGDVY